MWKNVVKTLGLLETGALNLYRRLLNLRKIGGLDIKWMDRHVRHQKASALQSSSF
jgi:hypothetical protein